MIKRKHSKSTNFSHAQFERCKKVYPGMKQSSESVPLSLKNIPHKICGNTINNSHHPRSMSPYGITRAQWAHTIGLTQYRDWWCPGFTKPFLWHDWLQLCSINTFIFLGDQQPTSNLCQRISHRMYHIHLVKCHTYHQVSNIRRTLVGN